MYWSDDESDAICAYGFGNYNAADEYCQFMCPDRELCREIYQEGQPWWTPDTEHWAWVPQAPPPPIIERVRRLWFNLRQKIRLPRRCSECGKLIWVRWGYGQEMCDECFDADIPF